MKNIELENLLKNDGFLDSFFNFFQDEKIIIKDEISYSLVECIDKASCELIEYIYCFYYNYYNVTKVKNISQKRKVLKIEIINKFKSFLDTLNSNDIKLLKELEKNQKTTFKNIDLISQGFLFGFYDNKEIVYIFPTELLKLYQEKFTEEYENKFNKKRLENILFVYIFINGSIEKKFLINLIKEKYNISMPTKEIDKTVESLGLFQNEKYYVFSKDIYDNFLDKLLNLKQKFSYYELEEFEVNDYRFYIKNMLEKLNNITKNINLSVSTFLEASSSSDILYDLIFKYLKEQKINVNKCNKIIDILKKEKDNIRYWNLNGRNLLDNKKEEILENFVISEKPKQTDLKSCLKSLSINAYNQICCYYNESEINNLLKKIISSFQEINDTKSNLTKFLLKIQDSEFISYFFSEYFKKGFGFLYKDNDKIKIFLPDELINIIENEKNIDINGLVFNYLEINGIILDKDLQNVLENYHNKKVSLKELDKTVKKIGFFKKDNYYHIISDLDAESLKKLIESKVDIPYKKFDSSISIRENELQSELESLNLVMLKLSNNDLDNLIGMIYFLIKQLIFSEESFYCCLEDSGINLKENSKKEIIRLAKKYKNDIAIWCYNGYTFNEYNNLTKKVKIGRNDPCICGSGKKYKKCCGKSVKI